MDEWEEQEVKTDIAVLFKLIDKYNRKIVDLENRIYDLEQQ